QLRQARAEPLVDGQHHQSADAQQRSAEDAPEHRHALFLLLLALHRLAHLGTLPHRLDEGGGEGVERAVAIGLALAHDGPSATWPRQRRVAEDHTHPHRHEQARSASAGTVEVVALTLRACAPSLALRASTLRASVTPSPPGPGAAGAEGPLP